MSEQMQTVTLARRPTGMPVPDDFALISGPLPTPADDEVLVKVSHLSLDPYMRGRMEDVKSYAEPVAIGGVMTGQGVGQVIASNSDDFKVGDTVTGMFGWASHGCLPARDIRKIDDKLPVSTALGVLGMPGFTGWIGLNEFGRPKAGETLVVAAATGPVGSMVGQLAKAAGLRTVAIAGGAEKCRIAKETFGFDEAIDHRAYDDASSLRKALAEAAPNGVDIYVENVGGKVLEAVLPLMNTHGRIPVIGTIAWYGGVDLDRPDQLPGLWRSVLVKRLSVNGLIIFDHWDQFGEFLTEVSPMVTSKQLQYLEDTAQGLAAAPEAFIDMLKGGNTGKQIVAI